METNVRKIHLIEKLNYDLGGIWTPDLCCSFITDKLLELHSLPRLEFWSSGLICTCKKKKPLSYSVHGDWGVFQNIINTSSCEDSISIFSRTLHKTQVNFDPDVKVKSCSTPIHKTDQYRSRSWNYVELYPRHWNQVNIDHRDKTQVIFEGHAKNQSNLRPVPLNRVNFDHYHTRTNEVNRSLRTKQVNFAPHKVNFDPPHKNKSLLIPTPKPTQIWSLTQKIKLISTPLLKSCQLDTHPKNKSISMPPHKDKLISVHTLYQVLFAPDAITKSNSIPTLNSSQFRFHSKIKSIFIPWQQNQISFHPLNRVNISNHSKTKSVAIPTLKSSQVRSPTLTKPIWIQTRIPSHFRPPHKNQVNPDLYTEMKSSSILHMKSNQYRPPTKIEVNFDAHNIAKRILVCIQKHVNFDSHAEHQVKFAPQIITKVFSARTQDRSRF